MTSAIEIQRKKLIYRSLHRGTKEMDRLLGGFAESEVPNMGDDELDAYESLMEEPDPDLYYWITGQREVPTEKQTDILSRIIEFHGFAPHY